jgi:glycine dehydrogenase subunit 1
MPFIPHTESDIRTMLDAIGVRSIDDLFDEIPLELRTRGLDGVPPAVNEQEITRIMEDFAARDGRALCFLGAGAYEHHIPAAVWAITTRGEFYSAYTPYQAEASQGTLQLIYEYQTMMANLTALDVSNASLYDGGSALAEACLMAVRAHRKSKSARILLPATLNPTYRKVARSIAGLQEFAFEDLPYEATTGTLAPDSLRAYEGQDVTALVIQQPNFFGALEEVDALVDWAHRNGTLVIGVVNPTSLALLKPPGQWGERGVDIACGEGQPLGVPLSAGGPYFGFMTTRQEFVRQMPGRIVGRTVDIEGRPGFTLTLQAREQHIRRGKATSNICTNQGLLVTAATIYLTLLGPEGLERVAAVSHARTEELLQALSRIPGVRRRFDRPYFHEAVIELDCPVAPVLAALAERSILGGYDLGTEYPELNHCILVCATEARTEADIETYARTLTDVLKSTRAARTAGVTA